MTKEEAKWAQWCNDNGITIYPVVYKEAKPEKPPRVAIQVNDQYTDYPFVKTGELLWSQKNRAEQEQMAQKIADLYKMYYFRYNK